MRERSTQFLLVYVSPGTWRDTVYAQASELDTTQLRDFMANRVHQATHLAILSLHEFDSEMTLP